jgi:hypothetical protein
MADPEAPHLANFEFYWCETALSVFHMGCQPRLISFAAGDACVACRLGAAPCRGGSIRVSARQRGHRSR